MTAARKITVTDWKDKNFTFVLASNRKPLGLVECFAPGEFKLFDAAGAFVGWFPSKAAAVAAL